MKDYRLNYYSWYDKKRDLIQCLDCLKWYKSLITPHVKKHGYKNLRDYKIQNGILPQTPLRSKRMLNMASKHAFKMRANGKFKVFNKGQTSIPMFYRKNKSNFYQFKEISIMQGDSLRGRKHSMIHRLKNSEAHKKQNLSHLKKYWFKKGHMPPHLDSTWRKTYGKTTALRMAKSMIRMRKFKRNQRI